MKKYLVPMLLLLFTGSSMAASWYTPNCSGIGGQLKSRSGNKYHCEKTSSRMPQCPNGYTKKVNSTAKDQCERVTSNVTAPKCRLSVGQNQNNWRIVVTGGPDHCVHKTKNKGQKPLKCSGTGYSVSQNYQGNTDKCTKSGAVQRVQVSCNNNETHRTGGADKCEVTQYLKPRF
ncbi:MAG: hypothetical protein P8163_09330 [Candidatus Thiodiazotropha sp.]